jgi:hypothetical protein
MKYFFLHHTLDAWTNEILRQHERPVPGSDYNISQLLHDGTQIFIKIREPQRLLDAMEEIKPLSGADLRAALLKQGFIEPNEAFWFIWNGQPLFSKSGELINGSPA